MGVQGAYLYRPAYGAQGIIYSFIIDWNLSPSFTPQVI